MEIGSVVNNGVQIPNECTCIWCGGKMKRGGANRMGQELTASLYGATTAEQWLYMLVILERKLQVTK